MLFLGIDIGTSGVRSAVLDARGDVISMVRVPHAPQDPERVDATKWWNAVTDCLRKQNEDLHNKGRNPSEIGRLAVDGTSGSMVLTDENLLPVGRALMYNSKGFDVEAAAIAELAPDPHITRGSNSALGRAMRLVAETDRPAAHLLHQADFVAAKLLGYGGHSDHNNALKTGFDPALELWPEWIGRLIDPKLLPTAHQVGSPVGVISPDIVKHFGFAETVEVVAGTTDSIAAFLAGAPLENGVAVTSLGSTLAIKLLSPTRIDDPAIGLYSHRVRDLWLAGGASNTGGAVLLQYFTPDEMTMLSARMDPTVPTDTLYYPLKEPGERFPINDPLLEPQLAPRPKEDHLFLQGMFEGIARIEKMCFDAIASRGGTFPNRVFTAGGGANNPVWTEIRARALKLPIGEMEQSEAAVGAAKIARMASA